MKLVVDKKLRNSKMRAHTWVHLLYSALEKITQRNDIKQTGSYVDEDYWRLDFNADKSLKTEELIKIQELVNKWIFESIDIEIFETTLEKAKENWVKAFFDEKYENKVRVIKIPWIDSQLCWWTHSLNTSFIGAFKIISQDTIASWIKRVSIFTWPKVAIDSLEKEKYLNKIWKSLDCSVPQISQKLDKIQKEVEQYKSELENMKESMVIWQLRQLNKEDWQFNYKVKLENFSWIDFKSLVKKTKSNLNWKILIYSEKWNFAIISDGSFSAKDFAQENKLKWWWNENIVQWRDENILKLI